MPHPNPIALHLDESCHPSLAPGLRPQAIEVTTTQEVGLLGARDEEQLAHAHSGGRVLVTFDSDFVKLHRMGFEHSGIIYCHQGKHSIGDVVRGIALICEVYDARDFEGRLEFL